MTSCEKWSWTTIVNWYYANPDDIGINLLDHRLDRVLYFMNRTIQYGYPSMNFDLTSIIAHSDQRQPLRLMLFRGRRAHFRFGQFTFNANHMINFAYHVPSQRQSNFFAYHVPI